ncbi:MAG: hypothetical protein GY758_08370, partial [Fuerstiella sp.]|nr:hypothetical protein [Fuerstiella sp.]
DTTGTTADWLDVACMSLMAGSLLLLNSGIVHAGLRVHRTGAVAHPPFDRKYVGVYLPTLFTVAISAAIGSSGSRDFLIATKSCHVAYLTWLAVANLTAVWLFLSNRHSLGDNGTAAGFLLRFSGSLIVVTVLAGVYVSTGHKSKLEPFLRLTTSLSPIIPTLIFGWYVFRRRLLPMVFERTLAYGAILLAVFYLHRLTLSRMMASYS